MLVLQLALDGLTIGFLYGLVAVSFAMILNATKIWHFAHASTFTAGAYVIYVAHTLAGLPLWAAVAIAIAATAALGVAFDRLAYEPLRQRGSASMTYFIASLVLSTLIENVLTLVFRPDPKSFVAGDVSTTFKIGAITFTAWSVQVWATSLILFAAVLLFYRYTRVGQAAVALGTNPAMAEIIGIDAARVVRVVFILGSALTVPAAFLVGAHTGIRPVMGLPILLGAVVATVVGGLGSIPGAFVGGIVIGVLEGVAVWKISSEWQSAVAYALLFVIILFRPTGLFGIRLRTVKA